MEEANKMASHLTVHSVLDQHYRREAHKRMVNGAPSFNLPGHDIVCYWGSRNARGRVGLHPLEIAHQTSASRSRHDGFGEMNLIESGISGGEQG